MYFFLNPDYVNNNNNKQLLLLLLLLLICCRLEFLLLGLLVLRPSISSLLQVYYDSLFNYKMR